MNTPLTNDEIIHALGINESYIKTYASLGSYETIEQAMGDKPCLIILIEDRRRSGHWVSLCRTSHGYQYNNPYGTKYDSDLSIIGSMWNHILGNQRNTIERLLGEHNCTWNRVKMQGPTSETCGRYAIVFLHAMLSDHMTMSQYQEFMREQKQDHGSYDKAVVALTNA
jgi:hypothetical protein